MALPNPNESERERGDAGKSQSAEREKREAPHQPAIWKRVVLPREVSVKYLAEVSGDTLGEFLEEMRKLRILIDASRAVDFDDAAKILREYGIAADRDA